MDWKDFIVYLGLLLSVVKADYCLYDFFKTSQSIAPSSCDLVQSGQSLSKQCNPDDLATTVYPVQLDNKIFWLHKGDLCTAATCAALVLNSSDLLAPTSLYCFPCDNLNYFACDKNGLPCAPQTATVSASKSSTCNETWTRHGNRLFLINNVRRTLADCHEWCMDKNGTTVDHEIELKFVESVLIPDPDVAFYWVAVAIKAHRGGNLGTVLSTVKTRGSKFTPSFNIFDVDPSEKNNMYGCICIKKDKTYSQTTSTSTTSATSSTANTAGTAITTTTTMTKTSTMTTTPTKVTTTQASTSCSTTQRTYLSGEVLTGRYKNIKLYNGLMKNPGAATQMSAKRSPECAMKCDQKSDCNAFFFNKFTLSCQLLNGINPNFDSYPVSEAKYYERQ